MSVTSLLKNRNNPLKINKVTPVTPAYMAGVTSKPIINQRGNTGNTGNTEKQTDKPFFNIEDKPLQEAKKSLTDESVLKKVTPFGVTDRIKAKGFSFSLINDDDFEVTPKPSELQAAFLKRYKAEIISELKAHDLRYKAALPAINTWLDQIGEDDKELRQDVLNRCKNDTAALDYFLWRAEEVPKPFYKKVVMVKCTDCQHFDAIHPHGQGAGNCKVAATTAIVWHDDNRQCQNFMEIRHEDYSGHRRLPT